MTIVTISKALRSRSKFRVKVKVRSQYQVSGVYQSILRAGLADYSKRQLPSSVKQRGPLPVHELRTGMCVRNQGAYADIMADADDRLLIRA